ncbi:hypothetical protein T484DRAFT_1885027 [Baffinella frigidus]|nr:hypothetical protein T484DRAFT_1885027 [Cryptophyta sp. CCMP2293]
MVLHSQYVNLRIVGQPECGRIRHRVRGFRFPSLGVNPNLISEHNRICGL